jgi:arginine-tRNA-protein transferase
VSQPTSAELPPPLPPPVKVTLLTMGSHPCPYLPDRVARDRARLATQMPPALYHRFMDAGFRRSGRLIYQPACPTCRACRPIRVPVAGFRPSRSQRRTRKRNADLIVTVGSPEPTDEKFDLYRRYVCKRHGAADPAEDDFASFLYDSPVQTVEFTYRDGSGRLLAVGICDVCPHAMSSVYFYFDPHERRRGLGTFGVMREIAYAAEAGIPHYYLGFWIEGCRTMHYKAEFAPNEVLDAGGLWLAGGPSIAVGRGLE